MAQRRSEPDVFHQLEDCLEALRVLALKFSSHPAIVEPWLSRLNQEQRASAENLLHYLALRSQDLRGQQEMLARFGLSTLGRCEAHVKPTLDALLYNLALLRGARPNEKNLRAFVSDYDNLASRLQQNTERLLGSRPSARRGHIMVTLPTEAASDYALVRDLLESGMDCARINCAHDSPRAWAQMIRNLRHAERATGRQSRVLMDLPGPKLRTGPIRQVPGVLKVRPQRSRVGEVQRPARIWLTTDARKVRDFAMTDAVLAVAANWLSQVRARDRIRFVDARGSRRTWRVTAIMPEGCIVEGRKTAYISNGVTLAIRRKKGGKPVAGLEETVVASLLPVDDVIEVRTGDVLLVVDSNEPGAPSTHDQDGRLLSPGRVSLPIPQVYKGVRPGEPVYFDDGHIAAEIERVEAGEIRLRVTRTRKPVERLRSDKGINFPDSSFSVPALSTKDLEDLDFVARHADMVGLSFANSPADVSQLREELRKRGRHDIAVVVKIETKRGFSNLPFILLEAMCFPACGVMIARGDLAVEIGFERLAEVQEEIMWVCESAHVPVIWATQVLETLTKRGQATRAEISDAAMGQAAECVMLNKGRHIHKAVRVLDEILQRMQDHHAKKRSMLRKLQLASGLREKLREPNLGSN